MKGGTTTKAKAGNSGGQGCLGYTFRLRGVNYHWDGRGSGVHWDGSGGMGGDSSGGMGGDSSGGGWRREQRKQQGSGRGKKKEESASVTNELTSVKMDLKLLNCPVCLLQFVPPIYHCGSGHAICSVCYGECKQNCSTCSLPIGNVPSLALQSIMEGIHVSCAYSSFGCSRDSFPLKEKIDHEKKCSFIPCHCPMKMCDFKCPSSLLSAHIKQFHPLAEVQSFNYSDHFTVSLNPWDDFRLLLGSDDRVFLLVKERNKNLALGFMLSVVCLQPDLEEKRIGYELTVRGDDSTLSLVARAMNILQWRKDHILEWRKDVPMGVFLFVPGQIGGCFGISNEVNVCIKHP